MLGMKDSAGKRVIDVILVCTAVVFIVALIAYFAMGREYAIAEGDMITAKWSGYAANYLDAQNTFNQISSRRHMCLAAAIVSPVLFCASLYVRGAYKQKPEPRPTYDFNVNDTTDQK